MTQFCCQYVPAYTMGCGAPLEPGKLFCNAHAGTQCAVCGAQATHDCSYTAQFVCGTPLCSDCEGYEETDKPRGAWGFLNHSHRRKRIRAEPANPFLPPGTPPIQPERLYTRPTIGKAPPPMDNQHRKISGYRDLTQEEVDLMNEVKAFEVKAAELHARVDAALRKNTITPQQGRDLSMSRTDYENATSRLVRAIAHPISPWFPRVEG